jgi:DNA recombination protein RmuC
MLVIITCVLAIALLVALVLLLRTPKPDFSPMINRFDALEKAQERTDRAVGDQIALFRSEVDAKNRESREEANENRRGHREEIAGTLRSFNDSMLKGLADVRVAVDTRLKEIRDDNSLQLTKMRETVDEKLQGTLEKRLSESFQLVSERLEQVHKGLGEMSSLANGVGDLKRIFMNVKARGGWGELQLGALLEEILTSDQYGKNVRTKDNSQAAVEFALKLPGRDGVTTWLPIDAKFPLEDYQRLMDALERADAEAVDTASRQLEARFKGCAKAICEGYLNPPKTTDFAIMFLPTEGLYAEAARRPGLLDTIQREYRIVIAGPSTLWAILSALQMGFKTLAIEKRSSEVWHLLGAVKTQFGKFGETLEGVKRKLEQATNTMDDAAQRSRAIERRLRTVEELPEPEAAMLLPAESVADDEDDIPF